MKRPIKKLSNTIKIIILLALLSSCRKQSEIESIFIAKKNEYWKYQNNCFDSRGLYYQFKENGSYDKYSLSIKDGFTLSNSSVHSGPRIWSVKNDSTFAFKYGEYKIEKIKANEILLSYYRRDKKKCFAKLSIWINTPTGPKAKEISEK